MWSGWHAHSIIDAAHEAKVLKAQLTTEIKAVNDQHAADIKQNQTDTTLEQESAKVHSDNDVKRDTLLSATQGVTLTRSHEKVSNDKPDTPATPDCPDMRRNDTYLVCVNAAISGTTEAIAACKASGSSATVPGEPVPAS